MHHGKVSAGRGKIIIKKKNRESFWTGNEKSGENFGHV